jgi:hypothetical protein
VLDKDAGSWFIVDSSNTVIVSVMVEEKGRQTADKKEGRKPWTLREFGGQTVWDWLHLLSALAIPVVLAVAGLWFTAQLDERQRSIENQRAQAERELAEQRAQDEALQAYLNQMSQLILDRKLLEAAQGDPFHADPVYTLAQARTSTVILRLDAEHNTRVIRFLSDSGLAWSKASSGSATAWAIAENSGGPRDAPPASVNLLTGITLNRADLSGADLSWADLRQANLRGADLSEANLRGADLSGIGSSGDWILDNVDLSYADLQGADLSGADLSYADFQRADLSGAEHITNEELEQQASSLEGATMPNGQKYEDWLKDREKRQQDE